MLSDSALLEQTGARLAQRRIDFDLTQAELARQAGIGRSTVERMEAGHSTQLSSFIRVLRVLDLLQPFAKLLPEPGLSPMQLVKNQRKFRQRASPRSTRKPRPARDWEWGDDQ